MRRLESFYRPFHNLMSDGFIACWVGHGGMEWAGSCVCWTLCLMMVACGPLEPFCTTSLPLPWTQTQYASNTGLIAVSAPPICPAGDCTLLLHCYHISYGHGEFQTKLHMTYISVLAPKPSPLFALICPLSDVPKHGPLRHVCMLSRESFVNL